MIIPPHTRETNIDSIEGKFSALLSSVKVKIESKLERIDKISEKATEWIIQSSNLEEMMAKLIDIID